LLGEQILLPAGELGFQPGCGFGLPNWFAIRTTARHEKRVAAQLQEKRVLVFLPLIHQMHRWSDRQARVEVPLFSCYLFVRVLPTPEARLRLLDTPGVLGLVGYGKQWVAIADREIDSLQAAVSARVPFQANAFLTEGKRVRIRGGALDGVEGIVVGKGTDRSVVLSVEVLKRSVAVRVEGYDLEPV
jgi:transcription antitermination factor NusG